MVDRPGSPPLTGIPPLGDSTRRPRQDNRQAGYSPHPYSQPPAFSFFTDGASTGTVQSVVLGVPNAHMTQPVRDALDRLIGEVIRMQEDIVQRTAHEAYLDEQAHHCDLTGLLNRRGLAREISRNTIHLTQGGSGGTLVLFHLEGHEALRRTHGLGATEALSRHIGESLAAGLRQSDVAASLGGGDFAVFLALSHGDEAEVKAGALANQMNSPAFLWKDRPYPFTIIIGLACLQMDSTLDRLLADADADLMSGLAKR